MKMKKTLFRHSLSAYAGLAMLICFIISCIVFSPAKAADKTLWNDSDLNDLITTEYDVNADCDSAHITHITENITVDFVAEHHGITRDIPIGNNVYDIQNIKVKDYHYETSQDDDYLTIRIGDEDSTLTGIQSYTLSYDIVAYKDDDSTKDFLTLNLLPTGWETSIRQAKLTLSMPSEFNEKDLDIYYGAYDDSTSDWQSVFTKNYNSNTHTLTFQGTNIPADNGLTIQEDLPEGYWSDAMTYIEMHKAYLFITLAILIAGAFLSIVLWILFGRDPKLICPVEVRAPEDLTPAEIGYYIDGSIEKEELTSMILYFASKGYLTIHEYKKNKFELTKLKEWDDSLPEFCKPLLNGLFKDEETVQTDDLPESYLENLSESTTLLQDKCERDHGAIHDPRSLVARGFSIITLLVGFFLCFALEDVVTALIFTFIFLIPACISYLAQPKKQIVKKRIIYFVTFFASELFIIIAGASFSFGTNLPWLGIVSILALSINYYLSIYMLAPAKDQSILLGRIIGFRNFIRLAEYDKLKTLVDEDPEYFFHILPYAQVLGLTTHWAKKFNDMNLTRPTWYTSYSSTDFMFSTLWCYSMTHAITTSFPVVSTSGAAGGGGFSSGFSGGGFSGGGFGGGGGGGW